MKDTETRRTTTIKKGDEAEGKAACYMSCADI